jgi:mannose-6-phosphate isomerase-like protein (cupin superfamily)
MPEVVDLAQKFSLFSDQWRPRIVGQLNGQYVKLARLKGEFVWHRHDDADELFLVIAGTLRVLFRDGEARVEPGEFVIVPRGVDHLPVADEEVQALLFEPVTTLNTGNVMNERTVSNPEWI